MATDVLGLLGWIALSFAVAWVGGQARPGEWYEGIAKPDWTPPDFIFPIVWTALYLLMGIAAGLVWLRRDDPGAGLALGLFVVQLALNALWSWVFFGWHLIGWALGEIALLLAAIVATMAVFHRVRPVAAALLMPYAVWVAFATVLNAAIWRMNTG